MKTDKTILWAPRLPVMVLAITLIPVSGFASFLGRGAYTVLATNGLDDYTQNLRLDQTREAVSVVLFLPPYAQELEVANMPAAINDFQIGARDTSVGVNTVPEPSSGALAGFALLCLVIAIRKWYRPPL